MAMAMIDLANPSRFLGFPQAAAVAVGGHGAFCWPLGLYLALFVAPPDYQQGETVRIMYIHVPAAWLSMFGYGIMAVAALGTLVWRHPLADVDREERRADRRRLHLPRARHRLDLGQADVGHLLGVGRAADLRAGAAPMYLGLIAL